MVVDMGEKASEFRAKASLRGMQEEYQKKALGAFQRAQSLSPTDHLAAFYLALELAVSRQIPEALGYVRQALQLQGDDVHSLHLLALLLSAQKHYHDALNIIEMALSEYPENFMLVWSLAFLHNRLNVIPSYFVYIRILISCCQGNPYSSWGPGTKQHITRKQ
nr:tetratricopeptide repeat protein 7B-like isoform X2 [Oncorhynchus nerka]